jgi:fermentation-respiration switch protein FrsA (DUF1100 family)
MCLRSLKDVPSLAAVLLDAAAELVATKESRRMLESLVNRFIYYPEPHWMATPANLGLEAEDVFLSPEAGVQLHAWFFPHPEPLATLLFCHGNAGNVSHRLENVAYLLKIGLQVLLFDYRGYGHSSGQPSELGLYRDAATAWAHLVGRADTVGIPQVIFGRSLGGAVAVELAIHVEADALIIESTFTSIRTLARLIFPLALPALPVKYNSLSKIGQLKMPLLVIHGEQDELIPFAEGRALFEAASEPKTWYPIHGAGHNDTYLVGGEAYFHRLATFVADLSDG